MQDSGLHDLMARRGREGHACVAYWSKAQVVALLNPAAQAGRPPLCLLVSRTLYKASLAKHALPLS